jgi:hypothetical protein
VYDEGVGNVEADRDNDTTEEGLFDTEGELNMLLDKYNDAEACVTDDEADGKGEVEG